MFVSVCDAPSPKFTTTVESCRGLELPEPVGVIVTGTGTPTIAVSGAPMETDGAGDAVTTTSPLAVPALAVTVAVCVVLSVVRAMPFASERAVVDPRTPLLAVNSTCTPGNGLFDGSITSAEMVTVPPLWETLGG